MEKTVFHKIRRLFRLTFSICLCISVLSAKAQNGRITLNLQDVPLEQAMNEIKKQTRFLFVNQDVKDIDRKVSINATNKTITEVLNQLFNKTEIGYKIDRSSIFIYDKKDAEAKNPVSVKGRVTDPSGMPVIGASVILKGTTLGASTDADGAFSLQIPPPQQRPNWKSTFWVTNLCWLLLATVRRSISCSGNRPRRSNRSWSLLLVLNVSRKH